MNSTEEQAPLNTSVEATQSPGTPEHQKRSRNRRRRNRHAHDHKHQHKHKHKHKQQPPHTHSKLQESEGTHIHQAQQNHSTYDRNLHHRSQGGTGYGMKRDHVATESELSGVNIPAVLLPSYAHCLALMGITVPESPPHSEPPEPQEPTLTDAQQLEWEEQQMRQAHEQDQQTPTDEDEESKE